MDNFQRLVWGWLAIAAIWAVAYGSARAETGQFAATPVSVVCKNGLPSVPENCTRAAIPAQIRAQCTWYATDIATRVHTFGFGNVATCTQTPASTGYLSGVGYHDKQGIYRGSYATSGAIAYDCPSGTTSSGSGAATVCDWSCPTGSTYDQDLKACAPSACPKDKMVTGHTAVGASVGLVCMGGCQAVVVQANNQCAVGGVQKICGTWANTGAACTGGEAVATPGTADKTCPAGQVPGEFNGQTICVASGDPTKKTTKSTSTETTPAGDKITTETTVEEETMADGSTRTTTTIVKRDGMGNEVGREVIVETGPKATDTGGGGGDGTEPAPAFCEENPTAPVCKNSTWGGACGTFSCDGDAVQCAIAREIHQRNCELWQTTALSTLGADIAAGNDPEASQNPAAPANRETVDVSGSLNDADPYAGACPQDLTVQVMASSITVPFSVACDALTLAGYIVLAFSWVAAARIVGVF